MTRTLIRGGCVLSLDPAVGNHLQADVLIEEGRIAEVGGGLRVRDAEVVDAGGCIVMPGFVDAHRHLSESLFRGSGDLSLGHAAIAAHLSPDDAYAATLVGLLGAAAAGITSVADWLDVSGEAAEAARSAHVDSGLRSVLVGEAGSAGSERQSTAVATSLAQLEPVAERRGDGSRIHAHAVGEGTVVAAAAGLGDDVVLVHCSGLGEADFDAIAASGAGVVLAPSSEMARGWPPPRVQSLLDRSLRPGLAIDSELMAPGDMFAPMRATISLQHASYFDRKLAGKGGLPNLLSTREILRHATLDGARVLGLEEVTGSLTPGKAGDLIVLDASRPNIHPVNDPIGAVVWGMDTSNLRWVFVAGRALMRDGRLVADADQVRGLATAARDRVAAAAGLTAGARGGRG